MKNADVRDIDIHGMEFDLNLSKLRFQKNILHWYTINQRSLPWRKTHDPYAIWVSEVMLQQTSVKAVIPYFQKWMELFPSIDSLARSPLQKVLKAWEGLGYYARARNLHQASKIIKRDHQGRIPADYETLIKLPGFGPYTTAAVLSLAFEEAYPFLDANVRRVMIRLLGTQENTGPGLDKKLLDELSCLLPEKNSSDHNQALMELGALVCRPRSPLCLLCPIWEYCLAYQKGIQEIIPVSQKRIIEKIEAVVGIIRHKNRYLIQKRPSKGLLAGLWEFPGGKRKKGESLEQALDREIREELNVEVKNKTFLIRVSHSYTRFQVDLHAYTCSLKEMPLLQKGRYCWVSLKDFENFPLPSGSIKIVRFLAEKKQKKP